MDSGASLWLPPPSISLDSLSLSLFLTVMATEKYVWALCVCTEMGEGQNT